ncbi:MAG: hypothetical protein WCN95_15980, partial [bacterium]
MAVAVALIGAGCASPSDNYSSYFFIDGTPRERVQAVKPLPKVAVSDTAKAKGVIEPKEISRQKADLEQEQKARLAEVVKARQSGIAYWAGQGVPCDQTKAVELFRKAAEAGDVVASVYLGIANYGGKGARKDYKEAMRWYTTAALQGNPVAQFNLALMYHKGEGVLAKDEVSAVKWYRKAAEQGQVDAQYNLGIAYYSGEGTERDYRESLKWFAKAAENGKTEATTWVLLLRGKTESAEAKAKSGEPVIAVTAPPGDAYPFTMTRDSIFKAAFKHSAPEFIANAYVFLVADGTRRGKIKIDLAKDRQNFRLEARPILMCLAQSLKPEILERIERKTDSEGWLRRNDLNVEGLTTSFDPRKFTFTMETVPGIRDTQHHYMSSLIGDPFLTDAIHPARLSAFLNFSGKGVNRTLSGATATSDDPLETGINVDGAVNVGGVVVEGSAFGQNTGESSFQRGDVRMVYDQPRRAIRYSAGDLTYPTVGYQTRVNMGGIGVSKDFSLQPHVRAYKTGDFEFYLERQAEVKVWINDSLVTTLHLPAGTHDIRGLTLDAGMNDVSLVIEDAAGHRQVLQFSFIHDPILLVAGQSLFSCNAGVRRDVIDGDYRYDGSVPVLSASYLKGLTDEATLGCYAQADSSRALLGMAAVYAFALGTVQLDAAFSR